MKSRLRIVSGLAALAALFLAPLADASLTRASTAERAIEAPTLTLASPAAAPEPSEFSLFDGTEIARAAAESESAPSFHPLAAVSLLSKNEAEAPLVLVDELIYPKTRYWVFEFLGRPLVGVERGVSLELRWGCASFSCGLASGAVGWLSQDPLGDTDSPNLYGFVGMRPHEKTDPLGLCVLGLPCPGFVQRAIDSFADVTVQAVDATVSGANEYINAARAGVDATGEFVSDARTMLDHSKPKAERNAAYRRFGEAVVPFLLPELAGEMVEASVAARAASAGRAAASAGRATRAGAVDAAAGGEFADDALRMVEQPLKEGPAPYSARRQYLQKGTGRSAWNNAPEGSVSNSKACPTCSRDVFGNPNLGDLRNTPLGWDVDHVRKWEEIRRGLQARGATAAEYRKAYNDLDNTILRCRTCNRADNQVAP